MSEQPEILDPITIESGKKGTDKYQSLELEKWSFMTSTLNARHLAKIFEIVKTEAPDLMSGKILSNLDVLLTIAADHVTPILRNSLRGSSLNEKQKDQFIENLSFPQGLAFMEAVVKLNFFDPENRESVMKLLSLGQEETQEEQETDK